MRCPDCGARLGELKLPRGDFAYRCSRCGGFWIDSWAVNRLEGRWLATMRRISIDPLWLKGGKGECPQDGLMLTRFRSESVPENVEIKRCIRCGKWWFPRDNLFEYKQAVEAKLRYFQLWGKTIDFEAVALPILVLVILLLGLYVGVKLILLHPEVLIRAKELINSKIK